MDIILGQKTLDEVVAIVESSLPVPNGSTLVKESSWGRMVSSVEELTDHAMLNGEGGSEFHYSDGTTIKTTWRFYVAGFKTVVAIDQEEVIRTKK